MVIFGIVQSDHLLDSSPRGRRTQPSVSRRATLKHLLRGEEALALGVEFRPPGARVQVGRRAERRDPLGKREHAVGVAVRLREFGPGGDVSARVGGQREEARTRRGRCRGAAAACGRPPLHARMTTRELRAGASGPWCSRRRSCSRRCCCACINQPAPSALSRAGGDAPRADTAALKSVDEAALPARVHDARLARAVGRGAVHGVAAVCACEEREGGEEREDGGVLHGGGRGRADACRVMALCVGRSGMGGHTRRHGLSKGVRQRCRACVRDRMVHHGCLRYVGHAGA
jgi:hypothetical protein